MDKIITSELIDKINDFFLKYNISKDCDDIRENIKIITEAQCVGRYKDLRDKGGKYDSKTKEIILINSKITQRLFLHEYIHKKSAKHRFLRPDLLGISYNENFKKLNEAITEKITCEILNIAKIDQMLHPYFSMFVAIEELEKLISWDKIVQSYFFNDIKIYKQALGKDLKRFLDDVVKLYENYPLLYPKGSIKKTYYQYMHDDIVYIISNHTS